ncbi:HpcH/HpaI aldolase/citrate lyase family protein [Bradyrhizobium sp. CB2312]|nr:HpcH/HpaI aldolase/citrate lyase family protein [Bradyrhizobium sp. CB2312]WFU76971.1 HpcH/HpaI aldolase/citrate lyase family protein [Bradyrhizobium sp. CB2312]
MDLEKNSFKAAIRARKLQIGLWCSLCSSSATELVSDSGYDWMLLDTEHAPNELPGILDQLRSMNSGTAAAVVRPAWNDPVLIKRFLDVGAQTLLIPFVQNAAEAERAVASCRYPPLGLRGITGTARASRYGRVAGYLQEANEQICVLVQVETAVALSELEEIARVDGVDGIFIGPSDLSASVGHIGNPQHPDVQHLIKSAVERITSAGKAAGILATVEADARRYIEWGFNFVAVGSDLQLLARAADNLARSFR